MSVSDVLHPDGSDYDAFLQAELGQNRNGVAVTVLSALACAGLEPWTEAKELARLGKEDAAARLNTHLAAITDIPALAMAGGSSAGRIVALLPRQAPSVSSRTWQTGSIALPQVSLFWLVVAVFGIVTVARILLLAQGG